MNKVQKRIREVESFVERLVSRGKLESGRMDKVVRALKQLRKAIETTDNRLLQKAIDSLARCFLNVSD